VCVCVCVCVCLCMYVRPAGPTQPIIPKFGMGFSFHPGLAPSQGWPQMLAPRGTLIVTPSDIPWRIKNWAGASKQKFLLGMGLYIKILFAGAHPDPGPPGSTIPNGGVCFDNWAGASKQKLLFGVGLCIKILFVGGSPQPKAHWVLRSICTGLFHNEIVT
jgi:hypothetical protein